MACVLVPATEAIVTTVAKKIIEKKERKKCDKNRTDESINTDITEKIPFSRKINWLNNMLWGGTVLLIFEHVWHGEIVPWFPFLTAASNPTDTAEMLHEMATVGVTMACVVTLVWCGMVAVTSVMENKMLKERSKKANITE